MPIHSHHHGAPILVRRKGEAPGRMQVMEATLRLQMARRALHTGPCRYGRLQAPWQRKLRSSRSRGDALCLFLSADEGPNLTRPGDGLATVSGRRPAAYGRGWRPRGEAMHTVLWPRCPRAPPGPLPPGRRIASVSRCLCLQVRSQALSGIKSQRLAESCEAIPGALPSRGVDSAFLVRRATPERLERAALCSGAYSGSHRHAWKPRSPPQAGAA
jgi:hypothetical protein